jgi:hypothetical protein
MPARLKGVEHDVHLLKASVSDEPLPIVLDTRVLILSELVALRIINIWGSRL